MYVCVMMPLFSLTSYRRRTSTDTKAYHIATVDFYVVNTMINPCSRFVEKSEQEAVILDVGVRRQNWD